MRFKVIALLEKKLWQLKKTLTVANGAKSSALPKIGNSKLIVSSGPFEFDSLMHNVPQWSKAL